MSPSLSGSSTHFPLQHSDPELHEKPDEEQHLPSFELWRVQSPGEPLLKHASAALDDGHE
jgi:hypothetical protein